MTTFVKDTTRSKYLTSQQINSVFAKCFLFFLPKKDLGLSSTFQQRNARFGGHFSFLNVLFCLV